MHPNDKSLVDQLRAKAGIKEGDRTPLSEATLIDGVASNRESPESFYIPDEATRTGLTPGKFCKIGLERKEGPGERFWVEVTAVDEQGSYSGIVRNDLNFFAAEDGTPILFGPEHVINVP